MRMKVLFHRPMVYSGDGGSKVLAELGWGQCCAEGPWKTQKLPFFLDNGAFAAWKAGKSFPEAAFLRRLDKCYRLRLKPDFVVIPDVVANAAATFELSSRWVDLIPQQWPKYFALQDGMKTWDVGEFVFKKGIAGLFLGGTDWFKDNQAKRWRDFARERELKFHYARAGTPRKFEHAFILQSDSLDSTRLVRSGRDFTACKHIWLKGPHPRLFSEKGTA